MSGLIMECSTSKEVAMPRLLDSRGRRNPISSMPSGLEPFWKMWFSMARGMLYTMTIRSLRTRDGRFSFGVGNSSRIGNDGLISAYPIEYIPNAKIPCVTEHPPSNIIYLTCDAYGILPPVSRLTPEQAQ
jgi:hypothetical protein